MSDTKALEKYLHLHGEPTSGLVKEAAAELAELKEELETRTTQFQEALSESVKDKQTIARLRADLDEARKVIEKVATYWNNENARDYAVAWLKAHTEVEG